ncbi:MAG: NrsF family protein [Beijerinckiaceae bacterium]
MRTDDLIGLLARDATTVPPRPSAALARWLPPSFLLMAGLFLVAFGLRPNLMTPAVMYPTFIKIGFGVLLAGSAGFAAYRLTRPEARPTRYLLALIAAVAFLGFFLAVDQAWMSMPSPRWTSVLRCVTVIPLMALPPLAAFLFAMRDGAVTRPRLAGAAAGLASGGLAILAYALNCTEDSPLFVSLWYVLAALLAAAAGAWAGPRALRW